MINTFAGLQTGSQQVKVSLNHYFTKYFINLLGYFIDPPVKTKA